MTTLAQEDETRHETLKNIRMSPMCIHIVERGAKVFPRSAGGKSRRKHLELQLANLFRSVYSSDRTLYTLIRRLYKKIIAERSYTR